MRLRILSDLHFEFHADGGASFLASLPSMDADAVLLPGDLTNGAGLVAALTLCCRHFAPTPVLYVLGNHEFYGSSRPEVLAAVNAVGAACPNLHFLEDSVLELGGRRFLGSTLWFPWTEPGLWDAALSDFRAIAGFRSWLGKQAERSAEFLRRELRPGDIVLTHHLPHPACIHAKFGDSPLNRYFLHDLSPLIADAAPALWVHGHTHESVDLTVGATRIVCNPFGYVAHELNPAFAPALVVTL